MSHSCVKIDHEENAKSVNNFCFSNYYMQRSIFSQLFKKKSFFITLNVTVFKINLND